MGGAGIMSDVDARAVLYVRTITDGDGSHVATHHRIEPHRAFVTHSDVADNRRILTEIAVSAPPGAQASITLNKCHIFLSRF